MIGDLIPEETRTFQLGSQPAPALWFKTSAPRKWWQIEVRPPRRLTTRQQRRIRLRAGAMLHESTVGVDGVFGDLDDKWPREHEAERLARAFVHLPPDTVVTLTPFVWS